MYDSDFEKKVSHSSHHQQARSWEMYSVGCCVHKYQLDKMKVWRFFHKVQKQKFLPKNLASSNKKIKCIEIFFFARMRFLIFFFWELKHETFFCRVQKL